MQKKKFQKKVTDSELWDPNELDKIADSVLYYEKAIAIQRGEEPILNIYAGKGYFVVINFCGNDEYIFSIKDSLDDVIFDDLIGNYLKLIFFGVDKDETETFKEMMVFFEREIVENFMSDKIYDVI